MKAKSITLDLKVFVGLITTLLGVGGYATLCPTSGQADTNIEHRLELRDTVQSGINRYMLDSISRVGDKVDKLERKMDTMLTRQERLLSSILESMKQGGQVAARCRSLPDEYTMWDH